MACTKNSALNCPEIIYGNAVGVFYCKRGAAAMGKGYILDAYIFNMLVNKAQNANTQI